jgi:hypothetical protein
MLNLIARKFVNKLKEKNWLQPALSKPQKIASITTYALTIPQLITADVLLITGGAIEIQQTLAHYGVQHIVQSMDVTTIEQPINILNVYLGLNYEINGTAFVHFLVNYTIYCYPIICLLILTHCYVKYKTNKTNILVIRS